MDFSKVTVLCVGDVMLDRFVYGAMERISPEAPVPVVRLTHTREMLGGAGNVANNIAALGGRTILTGLIGQDDSGQSVRAALAKILGATANLVQTTRRPTICKTRCIAGSQQVVRIDEEGLQALQDSEEADLIAAALPWIGRVDAVILSDYGKGVLSPAVISCVIEAARAVSVPVFVDPKHKDFTRYRGATCIKPNLKELGLAAGEQVGDDAEVTGAALKVLKQTGAEAILVTRSEKGMVLVEAANGVHAVPARAREVFDVSGAGDTVIAAMALCYASGRSLPQAMHIANAAASVVVSKLGTATASVAEVLQELASQDVDGGRELNVGGLASLDRVRDQVVTWRQQGLRVGFTNGCFDILHAGHVSLLEYARGQCDRLVVALNTDRSVSRLKGPSRPINALELRAEVIGALRCVDCVVAFDEATPLQLIAELLPDVLVKGSDYTADKVVGADIVLAAGGRLVLAPLREGHSTSRLVSRLVDVAAE